jgi:FAD/FMN-containing dehydrogenase/Fe-S oxidoreductase
MSFNLLFNELKQRISGELRTDTFSRNIYSVDASIYEVQPLAVVLPKTEEDVVELLRLAARERLPVVPRGAATGITGGCLGRGIIIDSSKYLNQILEINLSEGYAVCQPGVVQDQLNAALAHADYCLGPETSTGNRATLGGMAANNAAGARSLLYGTMADHLEQVRMLLATGEQLEFGPLSFTAWEHKARAKNCEGEIYRELLRIIRGAEAEIDARFPKIPRRVSGYNLDACLEGLRAIGLISSPAEARSGHVNLSKLIAGSEGTLGFISQLRVKIVKKLKHAGLCLIFIEAEQMLKGLQHLEEMLAYHPVALELIDAKIIAMARLSPEVSGKLGWLPGSTAQALFAVEFAGEALSIVADQLAAFASGMQRLFSAHAVQCVTDPVQMRHVWEVRKAGLGLLLSKRSYSRALAFIEDLSLPPKQLPAFMHRFQEYLRSIGKEAGIYGHAGSGCMHLRPYIDLRQKEELALLKRMMLEVAQLVREHGGAMSGEHGDGLVRSWLNESMFGPTVYAAFLGVKQAFDPHNLMNPGKIVHGPPVEENLRLSPDQKIRHIPTFLDFSKEGGLALAADLCNGNGQCRKRETLMCPSFQASGDEYHTTRARAQSLRGIIHGTFPLDALAGQELYDVLDLCLECKGCKKECPSQVDMAKMKAEMLYQYQQKHGISLRNRIFGHLHQLDRLASPIAPLFNYLLGSALGKQLLQALGVAPERQLPLLTRERFSRWFHRQPQSSRPKTVWLFNDTYTEYHFPEVGQAAFQVLKQLGYQVRLLEGLCCGRPLMSKGLLPAAQKNALRVLQRLKKQVDDSDQIVLLEPSCASMLRDDFQGLLGGEQQASLGARCVTLEEFLVAELKAGQLPLQFAKREAQVLVHTHCHQKALSGSGAALQVLRGVEGFRVQEIQSGCCGMAGAFGYEKEHYALSMQIGELCLLPAVRAADASALIVASGVSCRTQILHGSGRRSLHLAEALIYQ